MLMLAFQYPLKRFGYWGETLNTFLAWPTHLVMVFLEQVFHFVFLRIIKKGFVTNQVFTIIHLCLLIV